jgi:glycerophosphoryl diester phosphodiesterase
MLVLGHRGASASHQENTLPAFRAALDQGADGVELDVRRTADGTLAIRHDGLLPDGRRLVDLGAGDLPDWMPDLAASLAALATARLVNTEIKNWPDDVDFDPSCALADAVVEVLRTRGELGDPRHVVSSFHLPTVDRVREVAPEVLTGWILFEPPPDAVQRVLDRGHAAVHPHHLFVTEALVEEAHAAGLQLNTWTCDDPERLRWLEAVGVDAVIVNDPAAALVALGRVPA